MRRWIWTLVAAGACVATSAHAVDESDFNVKTTRDLVDLCSVSSTSDMYGAAMGYCLGFVDAAHDYHAVVTHDDMLKPVACPGHTTTRQEVVDAFLAWARNNDGLLDSESPLNGLMRAAAATWPC